MEILNVLSCIFASIICAKSISDPATSAATMTALSYVSMFSVLVGDTLFQTNNLKYLATKFTVAFLMNTWGGMTQSARSPSTTMYWASHIFNVSRFSTLL